MSLSISTFELCFQIKTDNDSNEIEPDHQTEVVRVCILTIRASIVSTVQGGLRITVTRE